MNQSSRHSRFEVAYGFQPATPVGIILQLNSAPALVVDRLTDLASVIDVHRELLTLSNTSP